LGVAGRPVTGTAEALDGGKRWLNEVLADEPKRQPRPAWKNDRAIYAGIHDREGIGVEGQFVEVAQ